MNEKIQILLQTIDLPKKDYHLFLGSEIEKINYYQDDNFYEFIINIEKCLPTEIYEYLFNNISKVFPEADKVDVKFKVNDIEYSSINDYFNYIIDKLYSSSPLLVIYKDNEIKINKNQINFTVANKAEKMKIFNDSKKIINYFNKLGIKNIKISIDIDQAKSEAIRKEIEKTINVEIKKEKKEDNNIVIMGNEIKSKISKINDIIGEENDITIEAYIFAKPDIFESNKSNFKILTLKITDFTNSIYAKIFCREADVFNGLCKALKQGNWYRFRGYVKNDSFSKELVLNIRDVNKIPSKSEVIEDTALVKRVELHAHTFMSKMDGLIPPKQLISFAKKLGHKAVAVTDKNGVQAFPEIYDAMCEVNRGLAEGEEPFKVLFGAEFVMINDHVNIVTRSNDSELLSNTYVVFDVETTGFNAGGGDSIIEVGAVKIQNGEIIDTFSKLINPKRPLPAKIIEITKITDDMLVDCPSEEEVIKEFIKWYGNKPLVAHNAKFDMSFLEMACNKYNLGNVSNPVVDTLELSRALDSGQSRHSLSALVKRYNIEFDENSHHRADYDAKATAMVFHKMLKKLVDENYLVLSDLENLVSKEEIHKFGRAYHVNIIAKNREGLKNLFRIVSYATTKYLHKTPRILRSEIERLRDGLLIGSGCYESEVFIEARSKSEEEIANIMKFYDYVEVQPIEVYDHLVQTGNFGNHNELTEHIKKIVKVGNEAGALLVATSDAHHLTRNDKIFREVIINQKVPNGGFHPLYKKNIKNIPSFHFRTTDEMLDDFKFLDAEKAYEMIVTNTNKIADMVEMYEVILDTKGIPFSPKIDNADVEVREMVYDKAYSIYGNPLPELIEERIESELKGIIGGGFDVIYLISQKLVKKSNDDGYIVGSRGSVGSSFVATLMGITEVNPLPAHYVCPQCKHSIFEKNGVSLGSEYSSGYDLPTFKCPKCNTNMNREGQDMPFATFLGFNADKVPDIDLNFSGVYQWKAHEYTKELFGIDNVYRAGTIGTVAEKTAFGYVKGYCEYNNITNMRNAEVERLASGCTGVKRTTGQHPGGIIVVPDYKEVFDFTPYQFPADDIKSLWRTSHFDYHAIDQNLLKLDILGHDDPTILKMLGDATGIDVTKVDVSDPKVMEIFSSPEVLGVTKEQILCETGTLGVPEFGTKFVIGMLVDTKPKTFGELVKISGLSHGTDVWLGNAQELIINKVCEFKDVIGCRDDIMVYLMYSGLPPKDAFKIMEFVRKGKPSKDPDTWQTFASQMREYNVPEWYIESCRKIKYMFPKAHAAAYVMSAMRIAWFKVHKPIYYYAAYFSVRCTDFDIETMIKGYDSIRNVVVEIMNKGFDVTNKETAVLEVLQVALEASARGIKFANIDIEKSDNSDFIVLDEKTLLPPFRTIDGLGDLVAKKIIEERSNGKFLSIEDLQKRGKITTTTIEKMRFMGVLDNLDESSQLSLF